MATKIKKEMMEAFTTAIEDTLVDLQTPIYDLTDEQYQTIESVVLERRDTFLSLPTGAGKSLPFYIMSDVVSRLPQKIRRQLRLADRPIVIVLCPLVSLMESHQLHLESMGVQSCILGEDYHGVLNGDYTVVLGSPEAWLNNNTIRDLLLSDVYQKRVMAVVVDEAHCITQWGMSNERSQTAFREAFSRISELRSLVQSSVPILAVTATADIKSKSAIKKNLGMRKELEICRNPDRPNVQLISKKVGTAIEENFAWLVQSLKVKGLEHDRTIVYCQSIVECGALFRFLSRELKDMAYNGDKSYSNRIFAMYHHSTPKHIKDHVMQSLLSKDGVCRVVIATSALGMGVNIKDIRLVVTYGHSMPVEQYVQQIGRAGRDGLNSTALLMYHKYHLVHGDKSVKEFCALESCRREYIVNYFKHKETEFDGEKHLCCDNCAKSCQCGNDHDDKRFSAYIAPSPAPQFIRTVSSDDVDFLKDALQELEEKVFNPHVSISPLHKSVTSQIIEQAAYIDGMCYIIENLPVFRKDVATGIFDIFSELFEDFDYIEEVKNCDFMFDDYFTMVELSNAPFEHVENEDFDCDTYS